MTHDSLSTKKTYQPPDDIYPRVIHSKLLQAESSAQMPPLQILQRITAASVSESSRNQRWLDDFAGLSSDWFWEMDKNLRYCYLSDRFTEITGIPESLVLSMTDEEIGIIEHDVSAWREHLTDLQHHRSFRNFVFSRTHPDGRIVVLSLNGDALFDQSGIFLGYRGTGTENTNAMAADEAAQQTRALY